MWLLAQALARLGASVCLVVFDSGGELPSSVNGVQLVRRRPYRAGTGSRRKAREAAEIHASIAAANAEAVVARGARPLVAQVALSCKVQRRRFVYSSASIADFELERMDPRRRNVALFDLAIRLADTIVVQTEEQLVMCQRRFRRTPIVIRSVAERTATRARQPEAFLWAGRVCWYKRPLAYVELARAVPEARFWMVPVPEHSDDSRLLLEQVTRAASELPNLELLEPCPRERLTQLMERSVAVVNTADFEGLSNTLLEGWARGIPALALSHDPDGLIQRLQLGIFAHGSPERLVAAAHHLWAARADQDAISNRCRRYVTEHHNPEIVYERWLDVLGVTPPSQVFEPDMVEAL